MPCLCFHFSLPPHPPLSEEAGYQNWSRSRWCPALYLRSCFRVMIWPVFLSRPDPTPYSLRLVFEPLPSLRQGEGRDDKGREEKRRGASGVLFLRCKLRNVRHYHTSCEPADLLTISRLCSAPSVASISLWVFLCWWDHEQTAQRAHEQFTHKKKTLRCIVFKMPLDHSKHIWSWLGADLTGNRKQCPHSDLVLFHSLYTTGLITTNKRQEMKLQVCFLWLDKAMCAGNLFYAEQLLYVIMSAVSVTHSLYVSTGMSAVSVNHSLYVSTGMSAVLQHIPPPVLPLSCTALQWKQRHDRVLSSSIGGEIA